MEGSSQFSVCDACGSISANADVKKCKNCGAAISSTLDLSSDVDDEFLDLLDAVDVIANSHVEVVTAETIELDDFEELQLAGLLPHELLDSSQGVPFSTDRFNAVGLVQDSESWSEVEDKSIPILESDPTPKEGVKISETISQVFQDKTTVAGSASPVPRRPEGFQILKRRRSPTGRAKTNALGSSVHSEHTQLSSKLFQPVLPPPAPKDDFDLAWDMISTPSEVETE